MFETLFLQLVHLICEVFGNCSIRLNRFYETTDHLQQFRADTFSTFFNSEVFTLSSASSIKFIQVWPETLQPIEVFAPFLSVAFARFSVKERSFLSLFFFRFSNMRRWLYNSYPARPYRTIVNYLAFMHARLKYFSPLSHAINCFNYRGSSTQIKVKHILKEKLDRGFELEIERAWKYWFQDHRTSLLPAISKGQSRRAKKQNKKKKK